MPETCPFCSIEIVPEQQIILQNDTCRFIRMPQAVLLGSGLIVPRVHRTTVFDLTEREWLDTYDLLRQAKSLLDAEFSPDGYNVGWNVGRVGGQHVFHAHLHVIPRFADEPLADKGIRHWLKQPENIRPHQE